MNDEFSDLCDEDFDDGYHVWWPDIRQRLINARRWLGSMNRMIDEAFEDQELIGFVAQQAVENALKGWISAIDRDYANIHRIDLLADIMMDHVAEHSSPARDELVALVEFVSLPREQLAGLRDHEARGWLAQYAVDYRYGGAEHRVGPDGY